MHGFRLPSLAALSAPLCLFILLIVSEGAPPLVLALMIALGAGLVALVYWVLLKASGVVLFLRTSVAALLAIVVLMLLDDLLNLPIGGDLFEVESVLTILVVSPLAGLLAVAARSLVRELRR